VTLEPQVLQTVILTCFKPQTREELREALENEIRSFTIDKVEFSILTKH